MYLSLTQKKELIKVGERIEIEEKSASEYAPVNVDRDALRSKRVRLEKHEGIKTFTVDPFSAVLFRFINVPKHLALVDLKGKARSWCIPFSFLEDDTLQLKALSNSKRKEIEEDLKERMFYFDTGVDLALVSSLLDPKKWKRYDGVWVNTEVGR